MIQVFCQMLSRMDTLRGRLRAVTHDMANEVGMGKIIGPVSRNAYEHDSVKAAGFRRVAAGRACFKEFVTVDGPTLTRQPRQFGISQSREALRNC